MICNLRSDGAKYACVTEGAFWIESCLRRSTDVKEPSGKGSYKTIYSGVFDSRKVLCNKLKIKIRPAGLEPATPCLEVRSS